MFLLYSELFSLKIYLTYNMTTTFGQLPSPNNNGSGRRRDLRHRALGGVVLCDVGYPGIDRLNRDSSLESTEQGWQIWT